MCKLSNVTIVDQNIPTRRKILYVILTIIAIPSVIIISSGILLIISDPWMNDPVSPGREFAALGGSVVFATLATYLAVKFLVQLITVQNKWNIAKIIFLNYVIISIVLGMLLFLDGQTLWFLFPVHLLPVTLGSILTGMVYNFESIPYIDVLGVILSGGTLFLIYYLLYRKFKNS